MSVWGFIKRHSLALKLILTPILIFVVGFIVIISILPRDNDINFNEAMALAKKYFGCEKILWIDINGGMLGLEPGNESTVNRMRSHYLYYVVGEKDGQEVYIMIPSTPQLEKPFITTWAYDYSFAQIVEKFNECGAQYTAGVPDNYYSVSLDSYIDLEYGIGLNGLANYYEIGVDDETFYERLDVKAVFFYQWEESEVFHRCIVTQENGELKAYKVTKPLR